MMKKSLTLLALTPMMLVAGCHGAILGNLLVLGITVGIFVATLSLGRVAASSTASRSAETSTSSHG